MTREQVLTLIQAHLADELDIDPGNIECKCPTSRRRGS
jgi:hypothetical protein